jgi:hypothetical protein
MTDNAPQDFPDPPAVADASPNPADDTHLAVVGDALEEHGITQVVIHYDGSGDSGSVGEVDYTPADKSLPDWIDAKLRALAEGYCPEGYENNEGGYGTLTLNVLDGLAELEHHDRYEDAEDLDVPTVPLPQELQQRLTQLGVTAITAHFDGFGDSGQIDQMTVEPDSVTLDPGLSDALDDFLVEQLPGGWEINEGSFGDFQVDVANGQVTAEAFSRVAEEAHHISRWRWRS